MSAGRMACTQVLEISDIELRMNGPIFLQMILDKKIRGTLDQGTGCLELFEDSADDGVYPPALRTYDNMSKVVDILFARSQKIMA